MNQEILNIITNLPTEMQSEAFTIASEEILKAYYEGYNDGVSQLKENKGF